MGFTKLDSGILQSSIMAEDPATFKVWIALLASCRQDGVARVSSVFLEAVCRLELGVVDKALEILKAPDPRSRTKVDEGRRIKEVDGGYFLINYQKYRAFEYSVSNEALRKREVRKKKKGEEEEAEAERPGMSVSVPASEDKRKEIKDIADRWNKFAKAEGLPTIMGIPRGSARERHLLARIADGFDFDKVLEAIHYQDFLKGAGERGWVVNFDWILNPSNYLKLIEGNYTKVTRGDRTGAQENYKKK